MKLLAIAEQRRDWKCRCGQTIAHLALASIKIMRVNKSGLGAIQTKLLQMIFRRLGGIEAAAAMLAPIPASALIQVHTLPNVNVRREIV